MNKNRFFIFSTCILYTLTFLIAGCGDLKVDSSFNPPATKLAKFKALEIADFETQIDNVPKAALTTIPDEVAKLLASKKNTFQKVERGKIEDVPAEDTLILLGEITDYQSVKSFKAEGGALKFGVASLSIQIRLVEKATGEEVAAGEVSGSSSIGFLRDVGVTQGVYKGLAEEIVNSISQNH